MKMPAHLPIEVRLSTRLNGVEADLGTVVVPVPVKVTDAEHGTVDLALDGEELAALIRRAATALDSGTREGEG